MALIGKMGFFVIINSNTLNIFFSHFEGPGFSVRSEFSSRSEIPGSEFSMGLSFQGLRCDL